MASGTVTPPKLVEGPPRKPTLIESMMLGGCSAMFAVNFTHPIETVKTRMQASGLGIGETVGTLVKHEGIPAFWKGLVFAYGRELSYTSIKLGAYAPVRDMLGAGADAPFYLKFLAGAITGGTGSFIGNPFDVMKTLSQTNSGKSVGLSTLVMDMFKAQGIKGFYRGVEVNIMRACVLNATKMGCYDMTKGFVVEKTGWKRKDLKTSFSAAFVAGFFMTCTVSPFDMIRTKLMNQPAKEKLYNGFADCTVQTIKKDGFFSLWRGFVPIWARFAASKIGYKVRILYWQPEHPRDYTLIDFAREKGEKLAKGFGEMLVAAKPFSPFNTAEKEGREFFSTIEKRAGEEYGALLSGFPLLDRRIGGIHGINILGGGPKVGKSCFIVQVATELAGRKIPVLYYDFENGRQRLYQRTFSRLAKIETSRLAGDGLSSEEKKNYEQTRQAFEMMLRYFRVINDRKVSPELMRRHIDFLRHETRNEFTVVVIDSLHKLPFKDLREMRTGIDAWLRQMEAIRDELQVAFLVVSELSRGSAGKYDEEPHMGIFKGSGDIEYSADNAMVLLPEWDHMQEHLQERVNKLWLVGSRENPPGLVGEYVLDYPYWGFHERAAQ